ncbi:MAG: CBS domain-containing protein [Ectothiorhodospiraceae bacterium]|nr:CBS domain-containing protein [Ectothiorhodospiraceae bacterium]
MSENNDTMEENGQPRDDLPAVLEFLRRHAPFADMEAEHLDYLARRLKPVFYSRNDTITDPADGPASRLYIIRQGRVRGEAPDDGGNGVWELVTGELFPVGALLAHRPVQTLGRAAEDTVCYELPRNAFHTLLDRSTAFNDFCTRRLGNLLGQVRRQVQSSALEGLGGDTTLNFTLRQRLRREPVTCRPETPIREALQSMEREHVGSMLITDDHLRPLGVFTLPDLLTRVVLPSVQLERPISEVMTPDPISLPGTAFGFEAAMLMAHNGIRHICVVERERLLGVVSERDLFSMQRVGLVNLSRSITRAESVDVLRRVGKDIHLLVEQMIAQGVKVGQITQIITLLNDRIARRIIDLHLREADLPDVQLAWLVFGSEGRQEQTLKTDQDNGIIFETVKGGPSPDGVREKLLPLARQINEALDRCGFPLCPGNIMASNPDCCLSLEEWRERFRRWVDQGTPEHLLKAAIYFDFRVIHGPSHLADELRTWLLDRTAGNSRFRKQMALTALNLRPPLGLIRDFKLSSGGEHPNTLNLKLNGVAPFVDAARILALANRIPETNTTQRLGQAAQAGAVKERDAEAWIEAYDYIQMLRMRKNQEQAAAGQPLSNHVAPDSLNPLDRRILKEAFREARKLQSKLATDYQI